MSRYDWCYGVEPSTPYIMLYPSASVGDFASYSEANAWLQDVLAKALLGIDVIKETHGYTAEDSDFHFNEVVAQAKEHFYGAD